MNFLCRLGWHRPAPTPRWHAGLYFTKCLRCGSDLVRMPRGRWIVPSDVFVLWRDPAAVSAAASDAAASGDGGAGEVAPLVAQDDAAPTPAPISAEAPATLPEDADADTNRATGEGGRTHSAPSSNFMEEEPAPARAREGRAFAAEATRAAHEPFGQPDGRPAERWSLLWLAAALTGAGLLAGAAIATLSVATLFVRTGAPVISVPTPTAVVPPPAAASPAPPPRAEGTIVTADHRGCTRRERRRLRGRDRAAAAQQVRILEEDGHWVTLTRAGTPCWTLRTGHILPTAEP